MLRHITFFTIFALGFVASTHCLAQTAIKNICTIKGQEENTLTGLGLVVGLSGTGEAGDVPTMRALARSYELMGSPIGQAGMLLNRRDLEDLKNNKNIALVMVSATVPATGARRGTKVDCKVLGLSGKSLEGGYLAFAALQGPNTKDRRIFALASGELHITNPNALLNAEIHKGCQLEADFFNPYEKDGVVTLVVDHNRANFTTADNIVTTIFSRYYDGESDTAAVRAIAPGNIEVKIPETYVRQDAQIAFIAEILELEIYDPVPEARINIDERAGSIVISGNVEIGAVVVTHKNMVIESNPSMNTFQGLGTAPGSEAKLANLLEALNALKVPPRDQIDIIKGIDQNGSLHGKLLIK